MRCLWILTVLCTLLSMGLLMIVVGQNFMISVLDTGFVKQQAELNRNAKALSNSHFFKNSLENLLVENSQVMKNLEDQLNEIRPKVEEMKAAMDACETEKNSMNEEVANTETEQTETEATLKAESKGWAEEIVLLKEKLAAQSEICKYAKKDSLAHKLCGTEPAEPVQNSTKEIPQ